MVFEGGGVLAIFNPCVLRCPDGLPSEDFERMEGALLAAAEENSQSLNLEFDGARLISVDMRPEAYEGPEAMLLRLPGDILIVWP